MVNQIQLPVQGVAQQVNISKEGVMPELNRHKQGAGPGHRYACGCAVDFHAFQPYCATLVMQLKQNHSDNGAFNSSVITTAGKMQQWTELV